MSTVHVNRVLQVMRANGHVVFKEGRLVIPDVDRLRAACQLDPNYLHLERDEEENVALALDFKTLY